MEKKRNMSRDRFEPRFIELTNEQLAAMYSKQRPARRQVINELIQTLDEMHRDVLEQVVEQKQQEGFPEANALIDYIKSK